MTIPVNKKMDSGTAQPGLIDRYDRRLDYLRISVTDRCNLGCIYCMPRESLGKLAHGEILRYEEILRIVEIGVRLGISKIRVTGGEPLVRRGIYGFLGRLREKPQIKDISLTTNGILLAKHIDEIRAAGVHRINVSLESLDAKKYAEITGFDGFDRVWKGLMLAMEKGLSPIKVNIVALKGINDDELEAFARLTFDYPFHVRFIEHMPIGNSRFSTQTPLLAPEIKKRLSASLGPLIPLEHAANDGPAERYRFESAMGEIGLIRPISRHFCRTCNRLRLTANGQLRACLLSDRQIDLKRLIRQGSPDEAIADAFLDAVQHKPFEHGLKTACSDPVKSQMCSIGG